ncbi:MAG: peptidoglycan DD-metalloendopeptidase family protein [Alphaproteobacteria bacterium]
MTKIVLKKLIKKDIINNNKHRFIIIGYAVATLFACLIALSDNNPSNALISRNDSIGYLLLENNQDEFSPESSLYPSKPLENIKSLFDMVMPSGPQEVEKTISIKSGDTLLSILKSTGLENKEAYELNNTLCKQIDPRTLKIGQKIDITTLVDEETNKMLLLQKFVYHQSLDTRYTLSLNEDNDYVVEKEVDEHILEIKTTTGTISGILSTSMQKQGVPNTIIYEFTKIFSNTVDFNKDVQKGDKFEVVFENQISPNGNLIKTGKILYLSLTLRKNKIALYRFKDSKGNIDYFDDRGFAYSNKTLIRKPLAFQNARVSSPFGIRMHPILKRRITHWGIDYAAPTGTAIYAAGDGVIQVRKYNGGYGNYIKIRHNSEYSTAYGHMSRYGKNIYVGKRVKRGDVIGYVGSTGRSTGPHLHYEVIQAGRRVNPAKIKANTGENLKGTTFKKFKTHMASFQKTYSSLFASAK